MNRVDFLRRVPLFKDLEESDLAQLAEAIQLQSFPPETDIVEIGEPGQALLKAKSGGRNQVSHPVEA
jgi:signal-transduction protein with cAMP-binding, CBS, and nucleotidyltransferase domain